MVFANSGILRGGGLIPCSVSSPGSSHCPGQLFSRSALEGRGPCIVKQVRLGSQRGDVRTTCPFLRALQVDMDLAPLAVAWWTPSLPAINRPAFLEREVMGRGAQGLGPRPQGQASLLFHTSVSSSAKEGCKTGHLHSRVITGSRCVDI